MMMVLVGPAGVLDRWLGLLRTGRRERFLMNPTERNVYTWQS
jgi:hypothetical protein